MTAAPAATQFEGSLTGRGSHTTFPREPLLLGRNQITGTPTLAVVEERAQRVEPEALLERRLGVLLLELAQ